MSICVDTSSPEFRRAVNQLRIDSGTLEGIVHKLTNQHLENNPSKKEDYFPSTYEIIKELRHHNIGILDNNGSIKAYMSQGWYNPIVCKTLKEADTTISNIRKLIGINGGIIYKDNKGNYVVDCTSVRIPGIPFILDSTLLNQIQEQINKKSQESKILDALVNLIGTDNIVFKWETLRRQGETRDYTFENPPMVFNPTDRSISIDPINLKRVIRQLRAERLGKTAITQLLLHELSHQMTYGVLHTDSSMLSPEERKFKSNIIELWKEAKEKINTREYGLTTVDEFVSEALSNRNFQKVLATTQSSRKKSIWGRLLDIFNNILKTFKNNKTLVDNSLLEHTLLAVSDYYTYRDSYVDSTVQFLQDSDNIMQPSNVEQQELRKQYSDLVKKYSHFAHYQFREEKTKSGALFRYVNVPDVEYVAAVARVEQILREEGLDPNDFIFGSRRTHYQSNQMYISISLRNQKARIVEWEAAKEERIRKEREEKLIEQQKEDEYLDFIEREIASYRSTLSEDDLLKFDALPKDIQTGIVEHMFSLEEALEFYDAEAFQAPATLNPVVDAFAENSAEEAGTGNEEAKIVSEADSYMQEQLQITQQVNNLLDDTTLSANEVREVAEQAVWWISDHLTELQQNPEEAVRRYGDVLKGKDVSKMSRLDLLKALGPQNVVAMCKEIFSPKNNKFKNLSFIRKARKITNNWQAIMVLAQNYFLENEDFSLVLTPNGEAMEVNTDLNLDADNFNISQDEATIKEIEGNLQEHWQIETKTLDVLRSMSQQVKHALRQLYITDKDGNVETTDYGIKKRINVREATNSILRWTQGSLTLEDMVAKLQEKATESPWLNALITRLTDTSGKETDFQGQFFGTFCKHFQSYSVVIQEDGKYKSINVNESPALTEAMMQISSLQKIGEHPLFTNEGLNKETYNELKESYKEIEEASHNLNLEDTTQRSDIAKTLGYISNIFGYYVTPEMVEANLTTENFKSMYSALSYIMRSLEANKDNREYTPFGYGTKGSIRGNMRAFLKPITDTLEDTAISAFYDSGKMYQSYITPSYTSKLFQKFALTGREFDQFIQDEYGQYNWFHLGNDLETGWRNDWLRLLVNDENARKIFKHKVALNFNKKTYMRDMSDVEYALSLLTEYFSEKTGENKSKVPAWFRIPMLSNKPSSEFIRFYSERGSNYKDVIAEGLFNIFSQELSRIQTVEMRNLDSKDQRFIKNFDKNGRKFNFLDFMNDYLTGEQKNSELGKLIREKLDGKEINDARLHKLTLDVIKDTMQERADKIMSEWQEGGIIKGAKDIANIGTSDAEIVANLENFIWNDTYAAMNIMQLTITDIAYYKDAEDLQKRLAQIHAPGIRGNIHAVDYEGHEVTDGKERTIYLTDFDNVVSNIIDNVSIVFDRKIANATTDTERKGLEALKEALVGEEGQFRKINVADAQGYNSPTSYRKKALVFGRWSKQAEEVYQKLKKGEYTYSDLQVAFQPLKPFVYSQIAKDMGVSNAPMTTAKMPIQNKNSEYLLIMADAILQGEETGKPNLLRAIYQVMEESHYDENGNYKKDGIDTVQFESTVKSGLTGRINLNPYINVENGEAIAKAVLEASIYQTEDTDIEAINPETGDIETHTVPQKTGLYNKNVVQEIPFEDYCLQQEVPEHFKNHEQIHGSQLRYIIVSELADKDSFGNDAVYTVEGRKVSAKEFKAEYEQTVADNIQDSINELSRELNLSTFNTKERNIALSKILQREILSSPRYGVDLLLACSVDENGRFRIPLGDPIQSKRVEQLINSIIKNRINKQEIAGGPVVQVTNFGTSRQLNIRFKNRNKEGELLLTRNEFDGNDAEYKEYIKENQGGIAYFEVFAPIYTNNLFTQFADKNGNISIEAIEALDPDLLKMIGYRIPTEAKYSMAPLKIAGFLPREAGDGIMLPYDITLLTGSDFDVDKEYLMRLDYDLERTKTSKNELHKILYDELVKSQDGKKLNYTTKNALNDLIRRFLNDPYDKASLIGDKTSKEFLGMTKGAYSKLLKLYVPNAFTLNKPTSGRTYRNNKIVDMTYEVLTHEISAAEMLNPGGFDSQKKTGYMVTVFRDPSNTYTWEQLSSMSVDQLKDLSSKNKNLSFIDTHIQFYKQNAAAGSLIGIFAVNRTAHAVIENEGYQVDVNAACGITEPFTIAGMTFGNNMTIDVRFNREGESVGKVLGSLVASSVDAVKDPVLNLMNINRSTANILNALIRMGMPWENAALLLSQSAVSKVLASHSSRSVTENVSLNKVIKERLAQLEKDNDISNESPLQREELTKEELIKGIKDNVSPEIEYKVLKSILNISKLSTALRLPTFATRFNSISSAVGPLIIDNLAMEYNLSDLNANTKILDAEGNLVDVYDILRSHPILAGFAESLGIARNLFSTMPANSTGFRGILDSVAGLPVGKAILNDRSLLSKLSDFYQSYLAIAGGVVNEDRLIPVITRFPKKFIERGYKDKYKNNFLIQSIKYGTDKSGKGTLKIDTTGLDETVKQRLSSAWLDLHKENPELSLELFEYCFFRGGMGFSPKSFMNLVPVQVKEQIPKYVETYRILPATMAHLVFDQFVRNNWDNKSLVPLKSTRTLSLETGSSESEIRITKPEQVENMKKTPYFKIRVGDSVKMFRMELATDTELVYREVAPLGNNKDYLEISTSPIDKAKELVESPVEGTTAEEVVPMEEGTQIEEVEVPQTQVERQTEQDLLYQVYQVNGRTREEAEQNINKFKTKTEAEKKVFEKQIKSFIEKRFKTLGIEYNEELIDNVYKLMC